jgi:hypothetical protein
MAKYAKAIIWTSTVSLLVLSFMLINFWSITQTLTSQSLKSWRRGSVSQQPIHEMAQASPFLKPLTSRSETVRWVVLMTLNDGFYEYFTNWWAHYKLISTPMVVYIVAEVCVTQVPDEFFPLLHSASFAPILQ